MMIEREHPRPRRRLGPPVGVDGPGGVGQGVCDGVAVARAAAKPRASVASSQDKDVKAAFAEWKKPRPLMRQRNELKATTSEFTVDQGRAEDLITRYLTAALNDSLEDEEALDLGIDAAASLTRLTGLADILDSYVEAPAEAEDQPRTSELGPASTQTALATRHPRL